MRSLRLRWRTVKRDLYCWMARRTGEVIPGYMTLTVSRSKREAALISRTSSLMRSSVSGTRRMRINVARASSSRSIQFISIARIEMYFGQIPFINSHRGVYGKKNVPPPRIRDGTHCRARGNLHAMGDCPSPVPPMY